MSEEEIIKDLKNFIALAQKEENFIYYSEYKFDNELAERVQILLDLYNKEKEKNKKSEYYEMVADELYKNSISKDKINEKIEEYEEILQSSIIKEDYKKEVEHIIRVLEELKGE